MDPRILASAVTKWIHLTSACMVVGGLVYLRFLLLPALDGLPEAERAAVWGNAYKKSLRWTVWALLLLLLTGLDNIFKARKTLGGLPAEHLSAYWGVFWTKMALFGAALVLVHLLMIGAPPFRRIQERYRTWTGALVALVLVILFLSGYLNLTRLSMLPVK